MSRYPSLRSLCIPREGLPFYLACRSAINLGYTLGLPLSQPLSIHRHSGYHWTRGAFDSWLNQWYFHQNEPQLAVLASLYFSSTDNSAYRPCGTFSTLRYWCPILALTNQSISSSRSHPSPPSPRDNFGRRNDQRSCTLPGRSLHDPVFLTQPCSKFPISGGRINRIPSYKESYPV